MGNICDMSADELEREWLAAEYAINCGLDVTDEASAVAIQTEIEAEWDRRDQPKETEDDND